MKYLILFLSVFISTQAFSTEYYVATNGSNSNDGTTVETPFASVATAVSKVQAGDVIWVRGGTYPISVTISISKNGTASDSIFMMSYADEKPIFDFSGTEFGKKGISLSGSFWKIKGLEMMYAGDNGLFISGNNNTIEFCSFHDNKDTGLQLGNGAHDNKIINCDSYFNADPTDYGDADGFACKLDVGTNNYFYGCRSWYNCDDGWDGYLRGSDDVSTTIENCWTWGNGYFKDGTDAGAKANGNGFKVGGSDDKNLRHNFTVINCLAFNNKSKGFDQNNNKGNMFFYNCTGFGNKGNDYSIYLSLATGKIAEVKNCVLFNGKQSLANFTIQESNSWDSKFKVDASDFVSIDTTGVSWPRQADGSLPNIQLMHLAKGSDLIDAGIDLGLPFQGLAPDLGAFESSFVDSTNGVGVKQLTEAKFKVYQQDKATLKVSFSEENFGLSTVNILDLTGKKILGLKINDLNYVDGLIDLPAPNKPGVYLISLNGSKKFYTTKVMVK